MYDAKESEVDIIVAGISGMYQSDHKDNDEKYFSDCDVVTKRLFQQYAESYHVCECAKRNKG